MSVIELESLAYRQLVLIEQAQKNLAVINQEIQRRNQILPAENVKEEVKPVENPKKK